MTLETYLERRRTLAAPARNHREFCPQCRLAKVTCDCAKLTPFSTKTEFVILMHPEESRRRIATGRLTHRMLKTSHLFIDESFEENESVLDLLNDLNRECAVLFPGQASVEVEAWAGETNEKSTAKQTRTVFVLDGTWRTAKKMLKLSPSLAGLPRISFVPPRPSTFRIRKQPHENCFSTLEAVHHLIGILEPHLYERDRLIELFDSMVERQIRYAQNSRSVKKRLAPLCADR